MLYRYCLLYPPLAVWLTSCLFILQLMGQRHVQLLGRSVDLQMLITEHLNASLRKNIDYVISKFEASDLTSVMEIQALLSNVKMTHALLSRHLPLDPFEVSVIPACKSKLSELTL